MYHFIFYTYHFIFYVYFFANSFEKTAPFHKDLDNPVSKISKEHEGEPGEKSKGASKFSKKGLERVKIHLNPNSCRHKIQTHLSNNLHILWAEIDPESIPSELFFKFS